MSATVRYEEITCRSAMNRVSGMPFRWSLNPYRGCVHGCHYCFARRFHAYFDLNAGDDFTSIIFVKTNVGRVLREELSLRSWRRETVSVGTATDPYQPIEGKYRLTRACLEAFADWSSPMTLVTKGTMVVRDVDVLAELSRRTECTVCFSIITTDPQLARTLEPGTPPPAKRFEALRRLADAGVNAGVLLAPVLPGITDDKANIESVVRAASESGARFLSAVMLNLKPGTKEHYLEFVEAKYPHLTADYGRLFQRAYAPAWLQTDMKRRVAQVTAGFGIAERPDRGARKPTEPHQLGLAMP